jgi:hypothetical protein
MAVVRNVEAAVGKVCRVTTNKHENHHPFDAPGNLR